MPGNSWSTAKLLEFRVLGTEGREERPQGGDVPLAVAQLIEDLPLGRRGRDLKGAIERRVGRDHALRVIEDHQGLADRLHDRLGKLPGRLGLGQEVGESVQVFHRVDVDDHQHDPVDDVLGGPIRM